jgi:hypothetical protein
MKKVLVALFVAATAISTGQAQAGVHTDKSAHVLWWLPDNWSVQGDSTNTLTASDPKGEVALLFMLRNHKDMKAASAVIDETVGTLATDVKMGQAQHIEINGMEGSVVDATGMAEGKRVELSVLILKVPGNKFLTIFGVLESAHKKAHESDVKKVLQSLSPLKD